ncbi:MAG: alpha/beta hydrolase family protein [Actinomycetota bacterium]
MDRRPRKNPQRDLQTDEARLDVIVDGLRLHGRAYVPHDARGLVLLLHGIPSIHPPDPDDGGYAGLAKRLAAEGFAAAYVDMRAARSSPGFFSIEGWVRDATAALYAATSLAGARGLPVALVGSSAGGAVATEVARREPSVAALALLAAPASWISFAGEPREGLRRITEEAGMATAPEVQADPAGWAAEFESVCTEDSVSRVACPVLVVHGTEDDVVPVHHAARIADRARRAELRILQGEGHQLRRAEEAIELLVGFLRRHLR